MARVTVISSATRNAGSVVSATRTSTLEKVPLVDGKPQFGAAGTVVRLVGVLSAAEIADVRNGMGIKLEWSADGATNWLTVIGMSGWAGGIIDRSGNPSPPACTWSSTKVEPGSFRASVTTSRRYAWALDLETV